MAYTTYLSLKPQLAEFRSGSDRDNMSEISDSGTGGSMNSAMGSAEELQKVALILNISPDDVTQDRFRVDRRKLEAMLTEGVSEEESASKFFQRVMEDTATVVNWPTRLKIGAKSKKDPHVRVAGKQENVKLAREKIMQLLDTRCNRVTMKLDVSYTDHSHIIGKGGLTIKRVMEETGCHIHFPDSNRSNPMEKSNQVSIAGDMENVEKARARVRALTPLIFSFELPIMSSSHALPDASSPYVVQIQEKYNVQVMLRTRPKLHATLVMVKGQQWEVQSTMEATTLLINYMCGNLAQQTLVQMSLEITPMHHQVVMGRAASQLKVIMSNTKTQIMFPDATDPNIPMLKKSNITITGNIEDVYLARQQLIGSLPLVIMFDLPEEIKEIPNDQLNNLMQNLNVYINIRQKPKLCALSVIIKGIERNANDIYEARRHLLNLQESSIVASIPESYHIPILPGAADTPTHFNPFSPSHQNTIPQSPMGLAAPLQNLANNASRNYPLPPLRLSEISNFQGLNSPQYNPPTPGGYPSPMSPLNLSPSIFTPSWNLLTASPTPQTNGNVFQYPGIVPNPAHTYVQSPQQTLWGLNSMMSQAQAQAANSNMMSHMQHQHPLNLQQYCTTGSSQPHSLSSTGSQPNSLGHLLNVSSQASSGYHSNFTGSSASLDVHSVSGGESNGGSNFVSPSVSPISKGHSPAPSPTNNNNNGNSNPENNQNSNNELLNILSEMTDGDRRAPGFEKKTLETIQQSLSPLNDYGKMKLQANKAMKEPCASDSYRVPTSRWSGYGFSQTSPSHILSPSLQHQQQNSSVWSNNAGGNNNHRSPHKLTRPNIVETPCTPPQNDGSPQCRYKQLSNLLQEKGLEKYINLFQSHEVDISTFSSLTDGDLVEIGITAFGARKKMLMAISDLNKNMSIFNGSAAPGAERKAMRI